MLKFYVIFSLINIILIDKYTCELYESTTNVKIKPSDLKLDDNATTDFISFPENVDARKNFYNNPIFHQQHSHHDHHRQHEDEHTDAYNRNDDERTSKNSPFNNNNYNEDYGTRYKNNTDETVDVDGLKVNIY